MKSGTLKEVFTVFFKMGCLAFGGPAAHIALMEAEVVEKRKWLDHDTFLDLVGGTSLIPGPNSTEMTMHCGYVRAGKPGLFVAGASFIFPATIITGLLAWAYITYGHLPTVEPFVAGIKPAVLAIIAAAILKLGKKALKSWKLAILGALAITACLLGQSEIIVLLITGLVGAMYFNFEDRFNNRLSSIAPLGVFWSFLKVGSILYGSGYVLFAYLDAELVATGLLTRPQLLDAIAIGQFTPGPVLSTATFVGYQLSGPLGAIAATAGIFLPSFLFVLLLHPLVPKMRNSKFWSHFLNSVNVAAVGIMVAILFEMTGDAVNDWKSGMLALGSFALVFLIKKVNPMWIILGGAIAGYLLSYL